MKKLLMIPALMIFGFTLSACDVDEGGPEEMGENIEQTYNDAGNKVEDLCEDAKEGMNADDTDC